MAEWSSSLFDCFSPFNDCLLGCFCPCIIFGRTRHRLRHDKDLNGYSVCNGACMVWNLAACCGLHCIPNIVQRGEIRGSSNPPLSGNGCTDCLRGWCCSCCDLIQQDKQVAYMQLNGAPIAQQPMTNQQMAYQPQP